MGMKKLSRKELRKLPHKERKAIKKELKEKRFSDPYGVDDMTDEEFLSESKKLMWKARWRLSEGLILGILAVAALVIFWNDIF